MSDEDKIELLYEEDDEQAGDADGQLERAGEAELISLLASRLAMQRLLTRVSLARGMVAGSQGTAQDGEEQAAADDNDEADHAEGKQEQQDEAHQQEADRDEQHSHDNGQQEADGQAQATVPPTENGAPAKTNSASDSGRQVRQRCAGHALMHWPACMPRPVRCGC